MGVIPALFDRVGAFFDAHKTPAIDPGQGRFRPVFGPSTHGVIMCRDQREPDATSTWI
jgi:hypothetical protein